VVSRLTSTTLLAGRSQPGIEHSAKAAIPSTPTARLTDRSPMTGYFTGRHTARKANVARREWIGFAGDASE